MLKPFYFFKDKEKPNLLSYDAIGFELNECLVKFNQIKVTRLYIAGVLKDLQLCFKGYRKMVRQFNFDIDMKLFMNAAVWDIDNQTVIKLSEGNIVSHAVQGF
jgi:hypothetical protein